MAREQSYKYSAVDIQRYFSGSMPAREMHDMEKAALNDPFLADAMDGYRNAHAAATQRHLEEINHFLLKKHSAVIKQLPDTGFHWKRYIVAAACFMVLATGAWWFLRPPAGTGNNVALEQPATDMPAHISTPVIAPADTIKKAASGNIAIAAKQQQTKTPYSPKGNKTQPPASAPVATVAPVTPTPEETVANNPITTTANKDIAADSERKAPPTDDHKTEVATLLTGRVAGVATAPARDNPNDVVVIGYGTKKKRAAIGDINTNNLKIDTLQPKESPYPQGGWDSFYTKLGEALQVNQARADKLLHLQFTIDENGEPENFTVVKTPDTAIAAKAIDIIKKGPRWKKGRKKRKAEVKLNVD